MNDNAQNVIEKLLHETGREEIDNALACLLAQLSRQLAAIIKLMARDQAGHLSAIFLQFHEKVALTVYAHCLCCEAQGDDLKVAELGNCPLDG